MNLKRLLLRFTGGGGLLGLLALAAGGLFKIAAFVREAFIASHFGLSGLIAEGCALLASLRSCFERTATALLEPEMVRVQEA
jgi:hypothetical protein